MIDLVYSYPVTLAIVCPLIFLAGFVDAIAGGGGIIAVPAYLFAGLPFHTVYGSNKFAMSLGTAMSVRNYAKSGRIVWSVALAGVAGALPGAFLGTKLALWVPQDSLRIILMILLPLVAVFTFLNRGFGAGSVQPVTGRRALALGCVIGLSVGAYDGFFGPGAGMFYTLSLAVLVRLDLVKASGTTKVINMASNVSSAITYLVYGKVLFALAIPAMVSAMAGSFVGSRLAIKIGPKFIRPVILVMAGLLFVKVLFDLLAP
jgi:uncharacterized membrane protein YfcA